MDSGQESDLSSEDLQYAQFQAELERYDTIIDRAHDAAERDRRRREQELEVNSDDIYSDSELSMLASSLFNGIGGVEMGGGNTINSGMEGIEMSSGDSVV
jgi:hypothetical protein